MFKILKKIVPEQVRRKIDPRPRYRMALLAYWKKKDPMKAPERLRRFDGYDLKMAQDVAHACEDIKKIMNKKNIPLKDGHYVDCGANEGIVLNEINKNLLEFSLEAFEIQKELIPLIKNKVPRAEVKNIAVSDQAGELEIYLPSFYGTNFRGGSTIVREKFSEEELHEKRTIESIDFVQHLINLKSEHGFVAIKMDIEGAEYAILDSLLERCRIAEEFPIDFLIIEFHDKLNVGKNKSDYYVDALKALSVPVILWH